VIWVHGLDDDRVMALTDSGIDSLVQLKRLAPGQAIVANRTLALAMEWRLWRGLRSFPRRRLLARSPPKAARQPKAIGF
jgi:hypothetical protein